MPQYSKREYDFVKFEKAKAKNKKYSAILRNKTTKKTVRVNFGDSRYEQYKDSTGLGLWSHKNHLDVKRRKNYRLRHANHAGRPGFYSPGRFSYEKLW
jgi:hypothetical protein